MDPTEPYWHTNSSFSPPLSRRWDHWFQSEGEGPVFGSQSGAQLYGSPISSDSNKDSQSWMRGDELPNHQYATSDGAASYLSSSSESFQTQQWMWPLLQGVNVDEYVSSTIREPASGPLACAHSAEGTSSIPFSTGSTSSLSDAGEYDPMSKTHVPSHRHFSSRCSFMSKPVHPISFPDQTPEGEVHLFGSNSNSDHPNENVTLTSDPKIIQALTELRFISAFPEMATTQREGLRSGASSVDLPDFSERLEAENSGFLCNLSEGSKCGLCKRFLSQRSPWSSRWIVRSGDMPVAGVLSCCHVYHAECLEKTTPKTEKHDPPCPLCMKSVGENVSEQHFLRLKNGLPWLRSSGEDGPSRAWGCGQVGDCVEGALYPHAHSSLMLLNRNRLKKHLSLKGSSSKVLPDMLKKSGPISSQILHGRRSVDQAVGCSRIAAGHL